MKALITGATGQDGSYLAELLLERGYEVHGLLRRTSVFTTSRIDHIFDRLHLHHADLLDPSSLIHVLSKVQPDEVYNLAAQSHVAVSFEEPIYTAHSVGLGAMHMLEAVRMACPEARYYQASSSEMYGWVAETPQVETTPFHPRSPYGCAKVMAHHATVNYREAYGLRASCGILFNHESERRLETFVTRKITRAVGRIYHGLQQAVRLGNLDAQRDWGYAPDYVRAMWLMLQHDPDDFVVATGETRTVAQFAEAAFAAAGLDWREHVVVDEKYKRPAEVDLLLGDPSKARRVLDWQPQYKFDDWVRLMVEHDIDLAGQEA